MEEYNQEEELEQEQFQEEEEEEDLGMNEIYVAKAHFGDKQGAGRDKEWICDS